ncbi:SDR family NAD(P)-dependent oxidoreductase [Synechococcales cyanobacterium C]|uniref:SDR family NAD(P)-dependent oxidoreductase n=1 Tax=Petrachloros mirabilis ULC683 TaxID=2781853 RepID=A0A8K1ZX96_9CYAN|nr:SDR family NAD(P)-dependent oxidoreductase [Petrachloros mirabilis ULC683]
MNIQGKTALITGASRGIGRAIAIEFAQQGIKRLLLVSRNHQRLTEVATEAEALGAKVTLFPLDLAEPVAINIAVAKAWRDYGPIHILVNCAGVAHQSVFLASRPAQVEAEINTNLLGMYTITRLVARRMVAQQEGTIINVSSLMGKLAAPTMATYSATKYAIVGFTQALRGELAPHNIKVVSLLPSLTETDMTNRLDWFRWIIPTTPQRVAQSLVAGLRRGTAEILVGWQSHLAVWCDRIAPRLMEKILCFAAPLPDTNPQLTRLREARASSR